jgi:hypothetical protein
MAMALARQVQHWAEGVPGNGSAPVLFRRSSLGLMGLLTRVVFSPEQGPLLQSGHGKPAELWVQDLQLCGRDSVHQYTI